MERRTTWIAAGALALAIAVGGVGLALAGGNDDAGETPVTGTDLDRATQAALEHTGGGTVIETETGDDGAAYSVEIRQDDGTVVEVQLDESFNVTGDEVDDDGANGADDDGQTDD